MIDAIYIMSSGTTFRGKAPAPAESFVTLSWKHPDEEILVEFVYFGNYQNLVIYHEVRIEELSNLC